MSEEIKNELTVGEAGVPEQDPAPVAPADAAAANGDAFAAETVDFAQRLAAATEQMKASVQTEEAAAEDVPAEAPAAEETPAEETPAAAASATGTAQPAAPVQAEKTAAAAAENTGEKRRNPGRVWGVCIGIALGALCCGCIALLAGFAVNAGRAHNRPIQKFPQSNQAQQEKIPTDPETSLQVHEVPREEDGYTTQYIVEKVHESVVGIQLYDGLGLNAVGGGTGIVMSEDGYIITNAHVVMGGTNIAVVLEDETRHVARVIGYDEKTDLAVLKISAEGLKPAEFGDSDAVVLGEKAVVIGNPGGLDGSVSQGIISGLNREITIAQSDNTITEMTVIQTDAAINPGNSGGPLLNAWGQVVGISSAKIVASGYEGIGFAIPVNEAKPVIDNLIRYGYVKDRAVLGISVIALDPFTGPAQGLPEKGLYIATIEPYSDMLNHGIEAGDVILKANDVELLTTDDLTEELKKFRPGDTIRLEILHTYTNKVITADVLLKDVKAAEDAK